MVLDRYGGSLMAAQINRYHAGHSHAANNGAEASDNNVIWYI